MNPLDRKFKILFAVIEKYISTGEPVGSKTICEDFDLSFSSATIRNEMADLVSIGYLTQPHISAGRVPSDKGYRVYVNKLMKELPLSSEERSLINGELGRASVNPESLLECAAEILAVATGFTSVITTPLNQFARVRDVKFVQISQQGAMLVLITTSGMVKNKLFRCDYTLNEEILKMFEKIIREEFSGRPLTDINPENVGILVSGSREFSKMLLPVIDVLIETVKEAREVKVKISGKENILLFPDITKQTVIDLFRFFENDDKMLSLLNVGGYGINYIIGEENSYDELHDITVVSSKYRIANKFGVLGIVGPTRMNYNLVSEYLKYVSELIGKFLERILKGE